MLNEVDFLDLLKQLNNYVQNLSLDATGAIGEIVAEIILLRAFDKINNSFRD